MSAVISSKLQNLSVQIFKMDAVKACSEVLEFIRESDLNFVFSESPFGANISIKKSFRKYAIKRNRESQNIPQGEQIQDLKTSNEKLSQDIYNKQRIEITTGIIEVFYIVVLPILEIF